eukprot:2413407-Amphidinium_carterae.1
MGERCSCDYAVANIDQLVRFCFGIAVGVTAHHTHVWFMAWNRCYEPSRSVSVCGIGLCLKHWKFFADCWVERASSLHQLTRSRPSAPAKPLHLLVPAKSRRDFAARQMEECGSIALLKRRCYRRSAVSLQRSIRIG